MSENSCKHCGCPLLGGNKVWRTYAEKGGEPYGAHVVCEAREANLRDEPVSHGVIDPRPGSALHQQVGGDHYRTRAIQPVQYAEANGLMFLEACVVKRVTRHALPSGKGAEDIRKAIHELQLLLELRYGEPAA